MLLAAKLANQPLPSSAASAVILLLSVGGPVAVVPGAPSRQTSLDVVAQAAAQGKLLGMVNAVGDVADVLAMGADPSQQFVAAGDKGAYVSNQYEFGLRVVGGFG